MCSNCGGPNGRVRHDGSGEPECDQCYRSNLIDGLSTVDEPYVMVTGGQNNQGGCLTLTFPVSCKGRRRARRYARRLRRIGFAYLSIVSSSGSYDHEVVLDR